MMMIVCFPVTLPRYYRIVAVGIDSGRFARARVDSGGLVVFCVQLYNLSLGRST